MSYLSVKNKVKNIYRLDIILYLGIFTFLSCPSVSNKLKHRSSPHIYRCETMAICKTVNLFDSFVLRSENFIFW